MVPYNLVALLTFGYAEPTHFSRLEVALLGLFAVASLAGFWARFGQVLTRIRASKKDVNFRLGNIGRRTWDFFWEVMCQAKVIKQRPLPGLAHAFVFWGFCAFALVSLNHFASGFGIGFLSAEGFFGRIYFNFAAIFAALVAVSILGLFVRRFVIHPIWLGKRFLTNPDSSPF